MEKIRISASYHLSNGGAHPENTIEELKESINREKGFPIQRLKIQVNGIEFPDHKTMNECGISSCTEMRAELLISRNPLKIEVAYGGERRSVEVDKLDRISKLRYKLEEIDFRIPQQHVCCFNQRLMNKDETFEWHGVDQGDVIRVFRPWF